MNSASGKGAMKGTLYTTSNGIDHDKDRSHVKTSAQIQNVKSAKVYVFGEADVDEEELLNGDKECFELRPRGKSKAGHLSVHVKDEDDIVIIERQILKDETLQQIAVKYCCEIADLKRINNLMTEQDFFALQIIKVPVKKHSLVLEKLEEDIRQNEAESGRSVSFDSILVTEANISDNEWGDLDQDESENTEFIRKVSIRNTLMSQGDEARSFLQRMDSDIKNILTSTKSSKKKTLDEVRSSLTCRRIYPLKRQNSFLGADCGLRLGTIITVIIIIAVITPLAYYLYYEYVQKPHDHQGIGR